MYMVDSYGYDVDDPVKDIETYHEALSMLTKKAKEWSKEHGYTKEDAELEGYTEGDAHFMIGIDEKGVAIYSLVEVPDFKSKTEELLWKAKREMDRADYAAKDYIYSLCDNCVDIHTEMAKEYIDEAIKLI